MRLEDKENKNEQNMNAAGQYDKLLKTRSLLLSGEINKDSADKLIKDLLVLEAESSDPVRIFINSPGGDVDAGFAIYDMVRFVTCPVIMIGMGLVASAASLILLAVPAERRIGLPNSSYLIHQPLSEMKGNATDIEIHAMQLEKMKAKINCIIADATGMSLETVTADTDRDHWLDALEAQKYGLISRVVESRSKL
ncbi:MAG: ATP-dependent Clp protease proteolytic subunit [Spirochaetales bacterium]|nr:ATP-dependent Clp protease proteolytic subunit [Spirochaetales bacterium]MBQ3697534.1 ATP-dependent Clp protease proteolytic subunit [Spirochaetales bacterium]MBQ6124597.1 ATP-dependent Clp protease proteolytic subunit [Spirochaetales bacterium]